MSVATFVETSIVIESRFGAEGLHHLDLLVDRAGMVLAPVDVEQARPTRVSVAPCRDRSAECTMIGSTLAPGS
jgi:uncharacterized protein with PIN domain